MQRNRQFLSPQNPGARDLQRTRFGPLLLLLTACGGESGVPTHPTPGSGAIAVSVVSGNKQSGEVGLPLAQVLTVRVTRDGVPLGSVPLTWAALESGTIVGDTITDASGNATARWTLPPTAGPARARAVLRRDATVAPAAFEATALPGPPAEIRHDIPSFSTTDTLKLILGVYDRFGNGVPGSDVVLTLIRDGVTLHEQSRRTASSGTAGGPFPLGDASQAARFGGFRVQLSTAGLPTVELAIARVHTVRGMGWPCCFPGVPHIVWGPNTVTVPAGSTVYWGFTTAGHPIEVVGAGQLPGGAPEIGDIRTLGFDLPGTYRFRCTIHPNAFDESGTIIVTP